MGQPIHHDRKMFDRGAAVPFEQRNRSHELRALPEIGLKAVPILNLRFGLRCFDVVTGLNVARFLCDRVDFENGLVC
jgi:hypothetical protein